MRPQRRPGLIPARAGKTGAPARRHQGDWAHPRACGENLLLKAINQFSQGSSPRVRGKHESVGSLGRVSRLIPARAGKTRRGGGRARCTAAHPRACGENRARLARAPAQVGSSPRVRGKHRRLLALPALRRLIPARAGKTRARTRPTGASSAHPRACGENKSRAWEGWGTAGSSPRVRGKRGRAVLDEPVPGLIPARAGKTRDGGPRSARRAAHPRACGENFKLIGTYLGDLGSSPRVRGKPR